MDDGCITGKVMMIDFFDSQEFVHQPEVLQG